MRALHDASERQKMRSSRLEAIVGLGNRLRSTFDAGEVAHLAADTVRDTLAFRETALYLREPEEDVYRAAAVYGQDPEYDKVVRDRRIPAPSSAASSATSSATTTATSSITRATRGPRRSSSTSRRERCRTSGRACSIATTPCSSRSTTTTRR